MAKSKRVGTRSLRAFLIPVPLGAKIQPYHWWLCDELNMSEGERGHYYKPSCVGKALTSQGFGTLFEVRIMRPNKRGVAI